MSLGRHGDDLGLVVRFGVRYGWFMATVSNTTQIEITKQPSYDVVYLVNKVYL